MKNFEKNWQEKLNNPNASDDLIDLAAKERIATKLFPTTKVRILPLWFTHIAALMAGVILAGSVFFYWDSTNNKRANPSVATIQTPIDTVFISIPTTTIVQPNTTTAKLKSSNPDRSFSIHSKDNTVKKDIATNQKTASSNNTQQSNKNGVLPLQDFLSSNKTTIKEDEELAKSISKNVPQKPKVLPVSDIAPIYNSIPFTERIAQHTLSKSNNQASEKSPFKFINKYQ